MTASRLPRRYGRYVAHYLIAQFQALVADPHLTSRRHGTDMIAAFVAEAAPFRPGLIRAGRMIGH
jgi:hypothetical protein